MQFRDAAPQYDEAKLPGCIVARRVRANGNSDYLCIAVRKFGDGDGEE